MSVASPIDAECAQDIRSAVFALDRAIAKAQERGLYVVIVINEQPPYVYNPVSLKSGDKLKVAHRAFVKVCLYTLALILAWAIYGTATAQTPRPRKHALVMGTA